MTRSLFKISTAFLSVFVSFAAKAQQDIVQRAIDKIKSAKNISYQATETGEQFGSNFNNKIVVSLYNRQTDGTYQFYHSDLYLSSGKLGYIDDGNQQVELNYSDSTYELLPERKKALPPATLNSLLSSIEDRLVKHKDHYTVKLLADSVIDKQLCYHIRAEATDYKDGSFDRLHLFISKKDYLILASKGELRSTFEKGGMKGGVMTQIVSSVYTNLHFSNTALTKPVSLLIPNGFKPKGDAVSLLKNGETAPQWTLKSTDGESLSLNDLKGKVVLLEFTFNGCPACMLALPSIEKLHKKYDGSDVAIVSVNFSDSKDDVAHFIKRNKIGSPIYIDGKPVSKLYHVSAGPTFYLIDKKGQINWSEPGYFEDFENKMTASIEALR